MRLILLFPLAAILLSLFAWHNPAWFTPAKGLIVPLLSVVMFGMGLSLHPRDFQRAFTMPRLISLGIVLQYSVMPIAALVISYVFGLDSLILIGMVLLGSCPGGTASNVICYLAGGNVALSISLTAISTMLAVVLTPLLSLLLLGQTIEVPAIDMLISIVKMIIAPVTLGLVLRHFFQRQLQPLTHWFPLISMVAIVYIIAIIVALNAQQFAQLSLALLFAVILHNLCGLFFGYSITRLLGYDARESRTLAIEVGMQNSGLAVALAIKYFPAIAAIPGAIFSIWHNISGSLLASYWSKRQ